MDDIIGRVIVGIIKDNLKMRILLDNNAEINLKVVHQDESYDIINALYYDGMNYHVIPEGEFDGN